MCTRWRCFYLARNSRLSIFRSKTLSIEANLTNAYRQNIRVDVPCRFTIAISTEAESMNTAAERLLGLSPNSRTSKDILLDNWLLPR
jgi:hypothetical protein